MNLLFIRLFVCGVGLLSLFSQQPQQRVFADSLPDEIPGKMSRILDSGKPGTLHVPLPKSVEIAMQKRNAPTRTPFNVRYNSGGCATGSTAWPDGAQQAFEYALGIWAVVLNGNRTVTIDACWTNTLGEGTLASTRSTRLFRNFSNAPQRDTWYPVALANQISNDDLNGGDSEIETTFSGAWSWYFGTDGNTPSTQHDIVSVALHEVGHGLGFTSEFTYSCTPVCTGSWGNFPMVYDRFITNGSGQTLVNTFANNSVALGNQFTSNALSFNGSTAVGANGNAPRIYAPVVWDNGSSIAHLDETVFDNTTNALMTPQIGRGESFHYPGAVGLAILSDIGWPQINLNQIWVNPANSGFENGSVSSPFNTIVEGAIATQDGGIIHIAAGNYPETLTISRAMILEATNGVAVIGR